MLNPAKVKTLYLGEAVLLRTMSSLILILLFLSKMHAQSSYATSICSGTSFSFTQPGAAAGTTYTWTNPTISPSGSITSGSAQSSPQSSVSQTLTNISATSATATYTVNTSANTTFQLIITVNPIPVLSSTTSPPAICSGNSFSYQPTSATAGTSFTWTRAFVNGVSNAASQGTGNPNETLINTTTNPITVSYVYTLTANGCSNNQTVTVSVNPIPTLTSSLTSLVICSGNNFNYPPSSATANTIFTWSRAPVTGISNNAGQGTGNPNEVLNNTTSNAISVGYIYTLTANGCSNNQTVMLTVNANPTLSTTLTPPAICSGSTFNYSPSSTFAGTNFAWSRNSGAGILPQTNSNTGNINEQLINTTLLPITVSYVYTLTNSAAVCSNTQTVRLTVNPVPSVSDQTISSCSGNGFISSPSNTPVGTLYTWSTPVISPSGSISGGTAVSVGQNYIGQVLTNNSGAAATAQYTVTPNTNGCVGSNFFVTVSVSTANSVAVLSSSLTPPDVCSGTPFSYQPASATTGTSFAWRRFYAAGISNGAGTGSGNINDTLFNTTTLPVTVYYAYTLTANGCSHTQQIAVIINPATALNTSLTPPAICSNTVFSYTPASNTPGTAFNWTRILVAGISNTAASGINNPNETLVNTTNQPVNVTYNYSLITANRCTNNQSVVVQVNPTPILNTNLTPPAICSGTVFNYSPQSAVANTTFSWSRAIVPAISNGPGSGTNNPAEVLVNTSTNAVAVPYSYTLSASGCTNNQVVTVAVNPTPNITNQATATCSGTAFSVTPANVPASTQYTWTLPVKNPTGSITGDSAQTVPQNKISQVLNNQTVNAATATYTVTPNASGCVGSSFTITVTVNPVPAVANQLLAPICSGTSFSYTPGNVPSGTTYTWSNPLLAPSNSLTGGSAQPISQTAISQTLNSVNNLSDTATYTVTPAANGCAGNTFTLTVPVKPVPVINNMTDTICSATSFSIVPTPVPVNTTYTWPTPVNFPFGAVIGGRAQVNPSSTISQTLVNTTNNAAQTVYTISPVSGNCPGAPFTLTVTVGVPLPFIPNQAVMICSGITFNATPTTAPAGTTYTWNIPVATPAGSVMGMSAANVPQTAVSQTLTNLINITDTVVYSIVPYNTGCQGNTFTATVRVLAVPKATITGRPVVCRYPYDTLSVSFTGRAPWSFNYSDSTGSHTQSGIITSPYTWVVPAVPNLPIRTFAIAGVRDFACTNTTDTFTFVQKINPLPVGKIISLHGVYLCNNISDTLFVSASAADTLSYQWSLNGTAIAGATRDSLVTLQQGRYNAVLTNQYGCVDTAAASVSLILITKPVLKFSYDSYCINNLIHFTNLTDTSFTGTIQWLWDLGDSTTSNTYHTTDTYRTGGDRHIRLTATQLNCAAYTVSLDSTFTIQFPIAAVRLPSVSAYKGVYTLLTGRNISGYRYKWNPTRGLTTPDSSSTNFNHSITQEYLINLISPGGCVTPDTMLVRVFDNNLVDILVPRSFTPNGDGINDILYPYLTGIKEFHFFKVYNRYGKLMFETRNPDAGWDGNYGGTQQPMSIYIWVAEGLANDGSLIKKTGEILLLR